MKSVEKWIGRLLICFFIGTVIWLNINRLQYNLYANYEKVVEYGRVREVKERIEPMMAAVFYEDKSEQKKHLAAYLSHTDNYRHHQVRMVAVPRRLNQGSEAVIKNLYGEIKKYNQIESISLVYTEGDDWHKHKDLLQNKMHPADIELLYLAEDDINAEQIIENELQKPRHLVIFLAALNQGLQGNNRDFLLEEAVYFAQRHSYRMNVFDVIDTQLAKAVEKDYASIFALSPGASKSKLAKQKDNLEAFAANYKDELLEYFLLNLHEKDTATIWPRKTPSTFRLFDRGDVYVKLTDENNVELFNYGRFGRNKSVIVTIIEIARKVSRRINLRNVKHIQLYLLTELEPVKYIGAVKLEDLLDNDDGVLARYENFYTIMLPSDRPDASQSLLDVLRQKVGVPVNAESKDMKFYKFKTAEIEYEN
ncbi:MAG: hypothetical protein J6Y91_02695 [Alphaproteobacteria bacterium]|nr:hypothetical protein [Alphaproteobacteria bacterium]